MADFLEFRKSKGEIPYTNIPMFPTGFMYLDYSNGRRHVIFDNKTEEPIAKMDVIGLPFSGITSVIGKSGTGKSTFCIQVAQASIHAFISKILAEGLLEDEMEDMLPLIEYYDAEKKFEISMAKRVTQYPNKILQKIFSVNRYSTDVEIIKAVNEHIEYKKKFQKKIKYKFRDMYGENFKGYPPSCIIIDSLNQIKNHKIADDYEKSVSNEAGMLKAKAIQNVMSYLSEIAEKYNINIFVIQHILEDINMGFTPKPKQYLGLKQNEKLVAGEKSILLSSTIIRLEQYDFIGERFLSGKKAREGGVDMGPGVSGFITSAIIIKSTFNTIGAMCRLVSLGETGFNRFLSTFYEATKREDLEKKGHFYYIPGCDKRLNMKNILKEVENDFFIATKLYDHLSRKLEPLITKVDKIDDGEIKSKVKDISDEFEDISNDMEDWDE